MSLLSNLTLAYEHLVDDPIEKGISYGKSILSAINGQAGLQPERAVLAAPQRAMISRRPQRDAQTMRSNYVDFRARTTPLPMRRQMVSSL